MTAIGTPGRRPFCTGPAATARRAPAATRRTWSWHAPADPGAALELTRRHRRGGLGRQRHQAPGARGVADHTVVEGGRAAGRITGGGVGGPVVELAGGDARPAQ